ncbi:toxin [Congregibacter litoralis]|nr:toxin [Congregibacter litoralis]
MTICTHTRRAIHFSMKVFDWSAEKNRLFVEERGLAFEEAAFYIQAGGLLDDIAHPNTSSYPNQRLFVVLIGDYVYLVPYVEDEERIFLKTIIPSRKFTKLYLGGAR